MADALNLTSLADALADAGSPWAMDETTSMALLTEDQRRVRLGFMPPPDEPSLEQAVAMDQARPPVTSAAIMAESEGIAAPAAYDLRNVDGKNYTTPVKDQGGCGSCVAFGSIAVMETTYKRRKNLPTAAVDLSEAQMFYCHGAEEGRNCANGWWPENAFNKAKDKGVAADSFFPYTAGNQACNVSSGWQNDCAKITGQTKMNSRADMKNWISTRGSLTGCFLVYQDFFSYRNGVYRHVSGEAAGGHCVEIIGYSDAQGCWICKNSWGPNWGEGGYFRIAYGEANIETWAGPFGVNEVVMRTWARDKRVLGLWANTADMNAYAYLGGVGWRRLTNTHPTAHHAMLTELTAAKAASRRVDALEDNGVISEVYVI